MFLNRSILKNKVGNMCTCKAFFVQAALSCVGCYLDSAAAVIHFVHNMTEGGKKNQERVSDKQTEEPVL